MNFKRTTTVAIFAVIAFLLAFSTGGASAQPEQVSTATIYDYLQTNGSFFVFSSVIARFDNLWPLLAGFPPGTVVGPETGTGGPLRLRRRGFLWEGSGSHPMEKRQATTGGPVYPANYTLLAPTDEALSEFFNSIPTISVLQSTYANPFWSLVSAYHVLNGTFDLAEITAASSGRNASLPTLTKYAEVNVTATGNGPTLNMTANSAHLLSNQPVKTGNGLVYPITRFIWPGDYNEYVDAFFLGVNEVVSLAVDVNGLAPPASAA